MICGKSEFITSNIKKNSNFQNHQIALKFYNLTKLSIKKFEGGYRTVYPFRKKHQNLLRDPSYGLAFDWLYSILMITATLFFRQSVTRFFPVLFVMNIFDEKYYWNRKKVKIIKTVTITVNIDFIQFSCFAGFISRSFVITEVVIVNSSLTFISHMPIE